MFKEGVKRLS